MKNKNVKALIVVLCLILISIFNLLGGFKAGYNQGVSVGNEIGKKQAFEDTYASLRIYRDDSHKLTNGSIYYIVATTPGNETSESIVFDRFGYFKESYYPENHYNNLIEFFRIYDSLHINESGLTITSLESGLYNKFTPNINVDSLCVVGVYADINQDVYVSGIYMFHDSLNELK